MWIYSPSCALMTFIAHKTASGEYKVSNGIKIRTEWWDGERDGRECSLDGRVCSCKTSIINILSWLTVLCTERVRRNRAYARTYSVYTLLRWCFYTTCLLHILWHVKYFYSITLFSPTRDFLFRNWRGLPSILSGSGFNETDLWRRNNWFILLLVLSD